MGNFVGVMTSLVISLCEHLQIILISKRTVSVERGKSLITGLANVFWDLLKSLEFISMPESTWACVGPL